MEAGPNGAPILAHDFQQLRRTRAPGTVQEGRSPRGPLIRLQGLPKEVAADSDGGPRLTDDGGGRIGVDGSGGVDKGAVIGDGAAGGVENGGDGERAGAIVGDQPLVDERAGDGAAA